MGFLLSYPDERLEVEASPWNNLASRVQVDHDEVFYLATWLNDTTNVGFDITQTSYVRLNIYTGLK